MMSSTIKSMTAINNEYETSSKSTRLMYLRQLENKRWQLQ